MTRSLATACGAARRSNHVARATSGPCGSRTHHADFARVGRHQRLYSPSFREVRPGFEPGPRSYEERLPPTTVPDPNNAAELGSFPASSAREKAMRGCSSSSVAKARLELACRSRARRSERRASTNSATWPWGPVPASPRNSESSCASQPSLERRRGCSCFADQARPLAGSVFHFDDEAGRNRTFSKRIKSPPCSHYTTTSIVRWMRRFNR